jgi:hypothetical protein
LLDLGGDLYCRLRGADVLFAIDNEGVERALRDDLTWRFGQDLRVIGESSAAAGLAALRRLAEVHELAA